MWGFTYLFSDRTFTNTFPWMWRLGECWLKSIQVITRGKGGGQVEVGKSKEARNGDGRRLDFESWTHNTLYKWHIIELYTWNLYSCINQCHPNKFNKSILKSIKLAVTQDSSLLLTCECTTGKFSLIYLTGLFTAITSSPNHLTDWMKRLPLMGTCMCGNQSCFLTQAKFQETEMHVGPHFLHRYTPLLLNKRGARFSVQANSY